MLVPDGLTTERLKVDKIARAVLSELSPKAPKLYLPIVFTLLNA